MLAVAEQPVVDRELRRVRLGAARALLADPGDVGEAVLVARVPEQLALRSGPLERDAGRQDVRLDDVLPQDLVEVKPLRRAEPLDRPRVVVDEVRLPAVCVSVRVGQTLGAEEEDRRALVDGLDAADPDDVRVEAERVPALCDRDRVAREEPPDEGQPRDELPRDVRDKVARLLQRGGDARGLERVRRGVLRVERVDDKPDDVAVARGNRLVQDRPSRAAPSSGVRASCKQLSDMGGVARVGGVVKPADAVGAHGARLRAHGASILRCNGTHGAHDDARLRAHVCADDGACGAHGVHLRAARRSAW